MSPVNPMTKLRTSSPTTGATGNLRRRPTTTYAPSTPMMAPEAPMPATFGWLRMYEQTLPPSPANR